MKIAHEQTEAEVRVLSVMLKGAGETYRVVSAGVKPDHFLDYRNRAIFAAITSSAANTQAVDLGAVWQELHTLDGKSPIALGELVEMESTLPTSGALQSCVEALLAKYRTRSLVTALSGALEAANQDAGTWNERWEAVSPHLEKAQAVTASTRARPVAEICESAKREIETPSLKKTIATGFQSWDKAAGPLRAGELITIAARPGCGKTAIGIQIADQVAQSGTGVAFFSLEMSGEELVNRIALNRVGKQAIRDPRLKIPALNDLGKLKTFHIYENSERQTLASIEARSRLIASAPKGLGLVVVDYLQLVTPSDQRMMREQQVAEMSRRFKELAGALKCPVIILAQLNRDSEKEERIPRLSDLRESGAIEQDSDRVWFLYQDPRDMPKTAEQPDDIKVSLIQAKCRGGKPWLSTQMEFQRPIFKFVPVAR